MKGLYTFVDVLGENSPKALEQVQNDKKRTFKMCENCNIPMKNNLHYKKHLEKCHKRKISTEMTKSRDESDCPKCKKSVEKGDMICCDKCKFWFHFECVGVLSEDSRVKNKNEPYFCPICESNAENDKQRKIILDVESIKSTQKSVEEYPSPRNEMMNLKSKNQVIIK